MTITRTQKINLGIFIIISLTILISAIFFLIGMKLWEKKDSYFIRFSSKTVSLSGLDVGSPVKYSGIKVGRVSSIKIDTSNVSVIIVRLELTENTPIAEDSTASLGNIGITGLKFIELSRGSPNSKLRKPGQEIPAGPSFIDEISGKATIIANKTEILLNRLNTFLSDDRQKKFWSLIETVETLAKKANYSLKEATPEFNKLSENLTKLSGQLNEVAASANQILMQNSQHINNIFKNTDELLTQVKSTRNKLDKLIIDARLTMNAMNSNLGEKGMKKTMTKLNSFLEQSTLMLKRSEEEIDLTLEHLREASENLNDFSEIIRENPSLLLRTQEASERKIK